VSGRERKGADLEALKKRLAEKEKQAAPKARPAKPPPPPARPVRPAEPAPPAAPAGPPVSFDDEMQRMGVAPAAGGPARVIVQPKARAPLVGSAGAGAELPPELDDDALWALSTKGVVDPKRGVDRRPPVRSEALPTLDLHGFSEEDALHELRRFVQLHRGTTPKWIRLITGRGTHGPGVLRRAAVGWMQANSSIATYRPAAPAEGGAGVLLVQLTRKTR
jgi:hypothetical protein